jgi:WD40 repeat protein
VATGNVSRNFEEYSNSVNSVAFSADGTRALSESDDKTLKLWDVATGRLLRTFEGYQPSRLRNWLGTPTAVLTN